MIRVDLQNVSDNSKGPVVTRVVIGFPFEHLGAEEEGGAACGGVEGVVGVGKFGSSKVCQLQNSFLVFGGPEDVFGLSGLALTLMSRGTIWWRWQK